MNINKKKEKARKQFELWQEEKQILLQKEQIKQQKRQIKEQFKVERKKLTTTKFLMFFLFASCTAIQGFTFFLTIVSAKMGMLDFSALQTLITAVVAEVVGFAVYSIKSLKQNTKGGIVYQTAMIQNSYNSTQEESDQEANG